MNGPDGALTARFELAEAVRGARVTKEVTLRPGHPVVYQRHVLAGGEGAVPVAHHAMIHVPGGARLSFSPKDFGATPATPQESDPARGRSILAYPQRFADLSEVRLADGQIRTARSYPFAEGHEDFLTLFDPPDARTGWSAAVASADGFVFFAVKDAQVLGQTSLWMSNGGRQLCALVVAAPGGARDRGELHAVRRRADRGGGAEQPFRGGVPDGGAAAPGRRGGDPLCVWARFRRRRDGRRSRISGWAAAS